MSPPETKAISEPSGPSAGSVKYGCAARSAGCARANDENNASAKRMAGSRRGWRKSRAGLIIGFGTFVRNTVEISRGILQHFAEVLKLLIQVW
jgi:hypothetical protein